MHRPGIVPLRMNRAGTETLVGTGMKTAGNQIKKNSRKPETGFDFGYQIN